MLSSHAVPRRTAATLESLGRFDTGTDNEGAERIHCGEETLGERMIGKDGQPSLVFGVRETKLLRSTS